MNKKNYLNTKENIRLYKNDNGTFTAAVYKRPVSFNDQGQLKDIDNTLVKRSEASGDVYENTANAFDVKFAHKAGHPKGLVRLSMNGHRISWDMEDGKKVDAQLMERKVQTEGEEKGNTKKRSKLGKLHEQRFKDATLQEVNSGIVYDEILKDVRLEYIVDGDRIKEKVVLKSKDAPYEVAFRLNLGDLIPHKGETGIQLVDAEEKAVFTIPRPFMYDGSKEMSDNVLMTLEPVENQKNKEDNAFILRLKADKAWLDSKERIWPVVIDPVVVTSTSAYDIKDTHICSGYPNTNYYTHEILKTGTASGTGTMRSLMKFPLPELGAADMVVSAQMVLTCRSASGASRQVNAHRVTSDWTSSTVTWNTRPSYDEKVIDFERFTDTYLGRVFFDVTGVVKDWYTKGENYGIMIKDYNEDGHYSDYVESDSYSGLEAYRPQILITYVNNNGLESYWTYHTQSIGRAGTGHVNDYNGNLVLTKGLAQTYGNRMPAALGLVYNSHDKDVDLGYGKGWRLNYHQTIAPETISNTQYYRYVDEDGTAHYFVKNSEGKWMDESGIQLELTVNTSSADRYTITDKKDGKLIFNSSGYLVKVMDANGNTLKVNWNGTKIASVADGVDQTLTLTYGSDGDLDKVAGSDGNVTFVHASGRLTTITDVDGKSVTYAYNSNGILNTATNVDNYKVVYAFTAVSPYRVTSVKEYGGSTLGQSYTVAYGDNIHTFTDHKGRVEHYMFNHAGNTVSIKNDQGYGQAYKYLDTAPNRMSNASKLQYAAVQKLKNPNVTSLANWSAYAGTGYTCSLNTAAANALVGSTSLKITSTSAAADNGHFSQLVELVKGKTYVFSAYVKASETLARGEKCFISARIINSAGNYQYFENRKAAPMPNGWYLMESAFTLPSNAQSTQVLLHAGLSGAAGTVYYDCLQLEDGEVASRHNLLENNDFANGLTGYAVASDCDMFDGIITLGATDTAPKAAIAGGYVNDGPLNVRSGPGTGYAIAGSAPHGQRLHILGQASDAYGTVWYNIAFASGTAVYSGYVSSVYVTKDQPTVYVNRGMVDTASLNVRSGAGTGYGALYLLTQDVQVDILETITSAAGQQWYFVTYLNGSNRYCGCVLSDYIRTFDKLPAPPDVVTSHGPMDSKVLRLTGRGNKVKKATQTLAISGNADDVYVINGWGAADTVSLSKDRTTTDDSTFGTEVEFVYTDGTTDKFNSNFGAATNQWQFLSDVVIAKKAYSSIKVSCIYGNNENTAYFDGLSFYKEEFGQSFTYDADGNVTKSADAAAKSSSFEYTNNDMTKLTDAKGNKFNYTYDTKHNVTEALSAANVKYTFAYDGYGNATESKVVDPNNTGNYIKTTATYQDNGNRIQKVTDALGNSVTYGYNTKGIVTSVTDALNHTATYSHDSLNRLTSVMQDVTINGATFTPHVSYGYDNDRLTTILHNGFAYQMAYDAFGKRTATKVAGTTLASHAYAGNNGLLTSTTYGNGTKLNYTYDTFDRVTKVTMTKDAVTTTLYQYVYDKQGNVAKVLDKVNNVTYRHFYDLTDRLVMTYDSLGNSYRYFYDNNDNLTKLTTVSATGTLTTAYTYDADNRETKITAKSKALTTAYDALGRVASKTWNTTSAFATTYAYKTGANGSQTSQLASINNKGSVISYNYDANGNITSMTDSAGTTTYHYNELNWLIREDNHRLGKTVAYIYDAAGNMTSKKTYALTAATAVLPATAESTVNYTYDTTWRDKMTAFGDKTITYDAIGNPTKYGDWNMSWTQGRRLQSMSTAAGDSLTYAYNEAGIRTKKVDNKNGLTYQYQLAGSKVVGERVTNTSNGSLVYANQYMYDSTGNIVSMVHTPAGQSAVEYYYVKNGQGDIIGLIDGAGSVVVNYSYDSWGKPISVTGNTTLGNRNPFRYRGYYYDAETGLHYLNSRYYNPDVGRFINVDNQLSSKGDSVQGYNLFEYCFNNPVNMSDSDGNWPKISSIFKTVAEVAFKVAVVAAVVAVAVAAAPAVLALGGVALSTAAISATAMVATTAAVYAAAAATVSLGSTAIATASSLIETKSSKTYSVYSLQDENGKTQYVGRVTDQGYTARMVYHEKTRGLTPEHRISGLTYAEARGLEEIGMIECHTINRNNPINNQIHGISASNKNGELYMQAACDYLFNRAENWVLNIFE